MSSKEILNQWFSSQSKVSPAFLCNGELDLLLCLIFPLLLALRCEANSLEWWNERDLGWDPDPAT